MPSYVLKCEACVRYEPFLVHADELLENDRRKLFERYCSTCRRTTNWTILFPDRRSGHDRRNSLDRRGKKMTNELK